MKKFMVIGAGLGALQIINDEAVSLMVICIIAVVLLAKLLGVASEVDR